MDRLQTDVASMIAHVKSLPRGASVEQLTNKVKALSLALQKVAVSLPKRIKEIIILSFNEMGYDIARQRVVNLSLFEESALLTTLQNISDNLANWSPPVNPSKEELENLSVACERLWELDGHRLVPDVDYVLNLQHGKKAYDAGDFAAKPLFTFVDEKSLQRPTYAAFIALLDNYSAQAGVSEVVTAAEKAENVKFLNLCMDTQVMQYVHQYLLAHRKTKATDRAQFIDELEEIWFGLYSRKAHNDSSGFEHVFVGEVKEDTQEITGFHNWIQIYLEERRSLQNQTNTFDYRGFIKPKRRALGGSQPSSHEQLITIQFQWHGALKTVSSSFVGTSPEFELALYTLCFYCGKEENAIRLGPYRVNITCHRWPAQSRAGQKQHVATVFPSELPLNEDEAATRIQARVRGKQYSNKYR